MRLIRLNALQFCHFWILIPSATLSLQLPFFPLRLCYAAPPSFYSTTILLLLLPSPLLFLPRFIGLFPWMWNENTGHGYRRRRNNRIENAWSNECRFRNLIEKIYEQTKTKTVCVSDCVWVTIASSGFSFFLLVDSEWMLLFPF